MIIVYRIGDKRMYEILEDGKNKSKQRNYRIYKNPEKVYDEYFCHGIEGRDELLEGIIFFSHNSEIARIQKTNYNKAIRNKSELERTIERAIDIYLQFYRFVDLNDIDKVPHYYHLENERDLKNNIASGYVFEVDDFAKFDGKTGPYIQYAIARINSILRKAGDIKPGKVIISNAEERDLALKLMQLSNIIMRTQEAKEPSIISDYAYTLAQTFSSFYNTSPIMSAESQELASSRLQLAKLVRDVLTLLLYLLGIEAPEVMLKKAE